MYLTVTTFGGYIRLELVKGYITCYLQNIRSTLRILQHVLLLCATCGLCISLLRHPCRVLKGQFSAADLLLTQVTVFPELSYSIQRSVMLETQATDLKEISRDTDLKKVFAQIYLIQSTY